MSNCLILFLLILYHQSSAEPIVIGTWQFTNAVTQGWSTLEKGQDAVSIVVAGCSVCEFEQCDFTVGFGGSPDETGDTTLDALIMDGTTMDIGAVAGLEQIKNAIGVARHVLENTKHSILVGRKATEFARQMGFRVEPLMTVHSVQTWINWLDRKCQPNFWKNVAPDSSYFCGPYNPISQNDINYSFRVDSLFDSNNHDTIGMIAIDKAGKIAAGTSTNGATHKIPGRIGDAPIVGAGAYADGEIGAAVATGDGDIMMRFLPTFYAVEEMKRGTSPTLAADMAIRRILKFYPEFMGAVIAVTINGEYGAACHGIDKFPFSLATANTSTTITEYVDCIVLKN